VDAFVRNMRIMKFPLSVLLALLAISISPQPALGAPASELYRWTQGNAPRAIDEMFETFGKSSLGPGQYVWASDIPEEGDTRLVIDLLTQLAFVYRGDELIGAAAISSGKDEKPTPLGFYSVLEKRRFYRSKKYDNAPMPFMQRIDDYGVALHGGDNPGFPASHGCIRLPYKFAERLFGLTEIGSKVVIEG
jgi:L,D-transpeptidase-like protein